MYDASMLLNLDHGEGSDEDGNKNNKIRIQDLAGKDFSKIFTKAESQSAELMPQYLDQNYVDFRYFIIAAGGRNINMRELEETSKRQKDKHICIDDLEVPPRKFLNIDEYIKKISQILGPETYKKISTSFVLYRNKECSAFELLKDFENVIGIVKAIKYYWGFAIVLRSSSELHKELRKTISRMKFKNDSCVLSKHGKSYKSIFKYLSKKVKEYLENHFDELPSFDEEKLNITISSIYGIESGLLIQGRFLQHYLSSKSLKSLIYIYFIDKESYNQIFVIKTLIIG